MSTEWLDSLIRRAGDFRSIAPVVAWVLQVVSDPKSDAGDLAEVISQDQALTARVLRVVNSAFYSLPEPVPTVQRATVLLGFNNVKSLAVGMTMASQMNVERSGGILNHIDFWQHAVACAAAAQLLANNKVGGVPPEEAFTAGLLHDMGKVVINHDFALRLSKCADWAARQRAPLYVAEAHEFGVTHAEVGRRLAQRWNFPARLTEAIGGHHAPLTLTRRDQVRLASVVALADLLCRVLDIASTPQDRRLFTNEAIWRRLNLRFIDAEPLLPELKTALTELWRVFDLPASSSALIGWKAAGPEAGTGSGAGSRKVLTIEAQPAGGSLARLVLAGYGIPVSTVRDKASAQRKIARSQPWAVILDLSNTAPRESAVLRAMTQGQIAVQTAAGKTVPIVVLSPQGVPVSQLPPGARLLTIPFEPRELLLALEEKLGRKRRR